jgi:hypothetical protein
LPTNKKQHIPNKSIAGLKNSAQNERYVSGIFDNEAKIGEE